VRLDLTLGLVESLVGYRTRRLQEDRERWHLGEDQLLVSYLEASRRMDRSQVGLGAVMPRGWLVVGACGLLPALAGGATGAGLAVAVGGVLLGYRGLARLADGFGALLGAAIAWGKARQLFFAAARSDEAAGPAAGIHLPSGPSRQGRPLLEAREVVYRHPGRPRPTLAGCDLAVAAGDRLLLEGPSGVGKSTLAAILSGMRRPEGGLLLLHGLDQRTLGLEAWRSRVVLAPQFHENHVFTGTIAFNLLLGRGWPPTDESLALAEEVCREVGLGPLLARMPSGMQQIVGETGWQLSQGERNRLFLARALLQGADLVILDESLSSLDPDNRERALACALKRAPSLMVIAQP
jgi:ATP-binding cassette subfamily B protein